MNGTIAQEIKSLLEDALTPESLEIINDSAQHHGHSGDDGSGESHFTLVVCSSDFVGKNRLQRQRMVIAALGDIVGNRVHAVAIKASAPGEKLR